jgi:hypothetical protein
MMLNPRSRTLLASVLVVASSSCGSKQVAPTIDVADAAPAQLERLGKNKDVCVFLAPTETTNDVAAASLVIKQLKKSDKYADYVRGIRPIENMLALKCSSEKAIPTAKYAQRAMWKAGFGGRVYVWGLDRRLTEFLG